MKPDIWYQRRLDKYFMDRYGEYEFDARFFNNPDINQWVFDIPDLKIRVELTCDDKGVVTEIIYYPPMEGRD